MAVYIQTGMRGMVARNDLRFRRQTQAAIVIQEAKTQENKKLQHALQEMEEAKSQEIENLQHAMQEMEEAKTRENEKLQHAMQEMEEAKTRENEKLQHALQEMEEAKAQEIENLQHALRVMEEAKAQEIENLQHALQEMEEAKAQEIENLQHALQEMEEAKAREIENLQHALQEMEEAKAREIENLKHALQEMDEAKTRENEKLQHDLQDMELQFQDTKHALQEMELQFEQTKATLIQEREELVNSLEKKSMQEFPANVSDNELINKLTTEREQLKDQVNSWEKKFDEVESKYEECNRLSEDRMNQIIETESKMIELKTNMQRLEEKISDMETENQVLRQQALLSSSSKKMSEKSLATTTSPVENGHQASQGSVPVKTFGLEADEVRRSLMERHRDSVDALFKCVIKDLGFSDGKPVAAFTLYNCLLHWKIFEAEKTSIFDHLIQLIGSAIEDQDNNDCMGYWLSNTSSLFFHLHRCLRVPTARKPPTPTSFFGRMTQVLTLSITI
ncbi:hypothetical protein RJT34_07924 [Clitoria ternatea]|uniref:Dilute domain-containing protein n=1 Tax=Clitoria ternatea TaxID=43366 RepID=A0AAN9PUI5_CLITE